MFDKGKGPGGVRRHTEDREVAPAIFGKGKLRRYPCAGGQVKQDKFRMVHCTLWGPRKPPRFPIFDAPEKEELEYLAKKGNYLKGRRGTGNGIPNARYYLCSARDFYWDFRCYDLRQAGSWPGRPQLRTHGIDIGPQAALFRDVLCSGGGWRCIWTGQKSNNGRILKRLNVFPSGDLHNLPTRETTLQNVEETYGNDGAALKATGNATKREEKSWNGRDGWLNWRLPTSEGFAGCSRVTLGRVEDERLLKIEDAEDVKSPIIRIWLSLRLLRSPSRLRAH
ncbi:hypothetical protein OF83DRAFT_1083760 [Amylostereum chailletii]|nr:hypothetical protein OF83DRAFT_1083760 [Amylostereum chailletii]